MAFVYFAKGTARYEAHQDGVARRGDGESYVNVIIDAGGWPVEAWQAMSDGPVRFGAHAVAALRLAEELRRKPCAASGRRAIADHPAPAPGWRCPECGGTATVWSSRNPWDSESQKAPETGHWEHTPRVFDRVRETLGEDHFKDPRTWGLLRPFLSADWGGHRLAPMELGPADTAFGVRV